MRAEIQGSEIHTFADFQRTAARLLGFYEYGGQNLAALRDRIVYDVERPIELIWHDAEKSRQQLGPEVFDQIRDVLAEAEEHDQRLGWNERFVYELR